MSYILDALKKSERQREVGRIPTLTDAPVVDAAGSTRINLPVIGALLLALLAVLLALYAVFNGHFLESHDPLEMPRVAAPGINVKAPEAPEHKDAAGTPAAVNLPAIGKSEEAAEGNEQPLQTTPPTSRTEETVAAAASQPRTVPDTVPPGEAVTKNPSAATSNDQPSPPKKRSEQPVPPEKTASTDSFARPSTPLQTTPEAKDALAAKRSKVVTPRSQPPVKTVRKKRPGSEHILPYDVYRRLPKRKVSALAYSKVPERRFVIVNSRKMREKESTEQGLEVDEILDDGVIFSFQGHRFFKQLIP